MAIRCCHGVTIAMTLIAAIMAGASIGLVWTRGTTGSHDVDLKLFNVCFDSNCKSWSDLIPHNSDPWCMPSVTAQTTSGSGSGQTTTTITSTNGITNSNALDVVRAVEVAAIVATLMLVMHAAVLTAWANSNIRSSCAPIATAIFSMLLAAGAGASWIGFEHLCNHTPCQKLTALMMLVSGNTTGECRETTGFGLVSMAAILGILTLCALCARRPSDELLYQQLALAQGMMYQQQQQAGLYAVPINGQQVVYGQPQVVVAVIEQPAPYTAAKTV